MSISREKIRFVPRLSALCDTTTTTIGGTTAPASNLVGYIVGFAITPSKAGPLFAVGVKLGVAAGSIRVAIYSTYSGSKFSGLLGQSASVTAIVGWNDLVCGQVNLVASTTYYIALQLNNNSASFYDVEGGTQYYATMTYGVFVDPSATLTSNSYTKHMRIITGKFS